MVNWAGFSGTVDLGAWEQAGTATMSPTRTATVEYWSGRSPGEGEKRYDRALGVEVTNRGQLIYPPPGTPAAPNARIQQHPTPAVRDAGGQSVTVHEYLVAVPRHWACTTRGWLKVIASSDDDLTGKWLKVTDLQHGSLRFERDLICTLNLA